jgi:hypothetical protein
MGYAEGSAALTWLREAIYLSAPITHRVGNRRYGDLLLRVEHEKLKELSIYEPDCVECDDTRKFIAYEPCMSCDDSNCEMALCRNAKRREWPCPTCTGTVDKREAILHNRGKRKHSKSRR